MALKLKGSTSGFVGLDAPATAGNNTLILPENSGSAFQLFANDITAGVTTFTQVTVSRNGDLTVPGTISIGGTLTYEDVTSVDSVGIVTARGLSIFGNTTGLSVTGVGTFAGDVSIADKIIHTGDTNTAIRFPANDTFTVETNGTERVRVTSDGNFGVATASPAQKLHVYGNSGTTAIALGDNSTTQPYMLLEARETQNTCTVHSRTSNPLTFEINQSERMHITPAGIVGVSTDSPTLNGGQQGIHIVSAEYPTLHLTNSTTGHGANNGSMLTLNNTGETIIRNGHASHIRFDTNNGSSIAERMRITAGGAVLINGQALSDVHTNADDVVIGNTSASLMGLSLVTSNSGYATLQFSDGAGNKNQGQIAYNHSNDSMIFTTAESTVMTIQSTGIVKVEKSDSSGLNAHFLVNNSESSSGLSMLGSGSSFSSGGWAPVSDAGHIRTSAGSANGLVLQASAGDMRFYVDGSPTERMRIASDGEVFIGEGLGNTNRSTLLSISGAYQEAGGALAHMGIYSSDSYAQDKGGSLLFGGQDGSVAKQYFAGIKGAKVNTTSGNYAGYMAFYTRPDGSTPVERMRMDEAGRIGMGVNPSHGRVQSAPIGFNPFGNTWLSGASFVAAGGYGGGVSLLDGSKGYSLSCYDNGNDFYIKPHASTTAAGSGGVYLNNAGTSWQSASDERDKENLVNITDAITKVKTLRTVIGNYTWKPENKIPFLIAQDVQAVLPEAVTIRNKNVEGEEERLGMSYQNVIPLLTAALKEAIAEIETLKAEVAALKGS